MAQLVHLEGRPTFYHGIDRPGELGGQDGQRLALAVVFLSAGQRLLARRMVAEAQDRRCREGPRERRMAELRAGGARALPGRFLGARDQAARGHTILAPWKAGDVMPLIQEPKTEDRANTRDTVWSKDSVVASGGLAVLTMATSRARSRWS
jgi:hypothetical protein